MQKQRYERKKENEIFLIHFALSTETTKKYIKMNFPGSIDDSTGKN